MSDPATVGVMALIGSAVQELWHRMSGHEQQHGIDDGEIDPPLDDRGSDHGGGGYSPEGDPIVPEMDGTQHGSTNGARYRPQTFEDFIGNDVAKTRIRFALEAAKREQRMPGHMLFFGDAGVGKTSIANITARALGAEAKTITGGVISNEMDLFSLLFDLYDQQRQGKETVLLIDEIHAIARGSTLPLEVWLPLLEDGKFFHSLKGKHLEHQRCSELAESHSHLIQEDYIELKPFTVIGMTTDPADLNDPVRDRFTFSIKLEPYTLEELTKVIQLHAEHRFQLVLDEDVAKSLASRSRGNPRRGINLLREVHDRSVVESQSISVTLIKAHMQLLGIEDDGLTQDDLKYLQALANNEKGLSIAGLASVVRVKRQTLETIFEPWLKYQGYVTVSNRRHLTNAGRLYLDRKGLLPMNGK